MTKILYQGHGSFRIESKKGTVVYLDPYAGEGYDKPADIILVTHQHFDHNVIEKPVHNPGCILYQNFDALKDGVYQSTKLKDISVTATEACNKNHPKAECVGYIINVDGYNLYFAGDTSATEQMKDLSKLPIEYAFLPGDGVYNMDVDEASRCADIIGAKHSVPVHLNPEGLFDMEKAKKFKGKNALIVEPGEEIIL